MKITTALVIIICGVSVYLNAATWWWNTQASRSRRGLAQQPMPWWIRPSDWVASAIDWMVAKWGRR